MKCVIVDHNGYTPDGKYRLVNTEPSDEMLRKFLAVTWPAIYRTHLRYPDSGPKTTEQTEKDITHALKQIASLIANSEVSFDSIELPHDLFTHKRAWRSALEISLQNATGDSVSYWEHEIKAFERTWDSLEGISPDVCKPWFDMLKGMQ